MPNERRLLLRIPEESAGRASSQRSLEHPRRFMLTQGFYLAQHSASVRARWRARQRQKQILVSNGSAVDAAIAAMFCNGLYNQQSMGLGGGFFMTVYIKEEGRAYTVIARETAPAAATANMFHGNYDKAKKGPLSLGIPGELRGLWAAYKRWGKLPWESLLAPTLALCENGYVMSKVLFDGLESAPYVKNDPNLRAKITDSLAVPLSNGDVLHVPPPPSSGVILVNILNILSGYNFTHNSINTTEDKILTYHRIIEAFKYAYATRTKLGDVDFLDLRDLIKNVTTPSYGAEIRARINDSSTSNDTAVYGATEYNQPDAGTAHISIIANNGDAVSVTSSVNYYFGAGFTTLNTGIVMNNVMDDFSLPGFTNYFGLKPSPANFIAPGKRPMSSMSPSIIVDKGGNAKLVIGASGGTKITTAVALVAMRKLWFGQTIKQAVDEARLHHQIFPQDIIKGLRAKGHGMERYPGRGSIICAMYRNRTGIYANADFRKGGDVAGID
ncbi:Gamma-glutamyltranspeptidase 1 [Papilio machaon]|uniref:Gamma-glutamyltranspeptidase 1 n=1 Tax=Papilio machaon TaxID=76193 RepID=A0A194QUB0_PAPMA|nr:Gamma-glutamyltranspeptidase 1 [Papilio machaon]